ncbi:MAG: Ig-like domain-containing protein [Micrococcales bacterium]|nr:Ig-like domain-containing protein [Micrococcales bacterium]
MAPKTARVLFSSLVVLSLGVVCAPGVGAAPTPMESPTGGGVRVSGTVPPKFTTVAAGGYGGYALDEAGHIWAWGYNNFGQLGNGTTTNSPRPVLVEGEGSETLPPFVAIAGGNYSAHALDEDGYVWGWGWNSSGQLGNGTTTISRWPVRVEAATSGTLPLFKAITSGGNTTFALDIYDRIWAWGYNSNGQVGNGNGENTSLPALVQASSGTLPPFAAIAAGYTTAYALDKSGHIWAWGDGGSGRLGNGGTSYSLFPVQAVAEPGKTLPVFSAISAGFSSGYALDKDGGAWAWGYNVWGQLGIGTNARSLWPTQVRVSSGTLPVFVEIAGGDAEAYALADDGSILAWGRGSSGALGDGTNDDSWWPVRVQAAGSGTLPPFTAITAGYEARYALDGDGRVWSWGYNMYGQAGNGTYATALNPVSVSPTVRQVTFGGVAGTDLSVSGGTWSVTAPPGCGPAPLMVTYGFGSGPDHQEYWGSFRYGSRPAVKTGPPSGVVVAGGAISLKVEVTGDPTPDVTWERRVGAGGWDPVPGGTGMTATVRPVVDTDYRAVATNCWSGAATSSVASVTVRSSPPPAPAPISVSPVSGAAGGGTSVSGVLPFQFTAIAAGAHAGYGLDKEGRIWAWGRNDSGQLGNGTQTDSRWPVLVKAGAGMLPRFTAIAAGSAMAYALDEDGHVWAWGDDSNNQLGIGTAIGAVTAPSKWPVRVQPASGVLPSFTAIAAGASTGYALDKDGNVWAWGYNAYGQLGNGVMYNSSSASRVAAAGPGTLPAFSAIAAGGNTGYALDFSGRIWAWGSNSVGQLGNGTTTHATRPGLVDAATPGTLPAFAMIAAGLSSGYAVDQTGAAWAWGANNYGQLGNGTSANTSRPDLVKSNGGTLPGFVTIAAGDSTGYAVDQGGRIHAWGRNDHGQLGDGTLGGASTWPVAVRGAGSTVLPPVKELAAGTSTAYAADKDGRLWSWGYNNYGQLGNGTATDSSSPASVSPTVTAVTFGDKPGARPSTTGGTWSVTTPAGCGRLPVKVTYGFGSSASDASAAGVFEFGKPPSITTQPTSRAVSAGGTFTATVAVAGDPMPAVKWQSRIGSGSWTDVPRASGTTLTARPTKTTAYRAVATNCWSTPTSHTAYSTSASATVHSPSPQSATTLAVAMKKLTMTKNTTLKAVWLAYPVGAKTALAWSSSSPKVAKVSASGKIKALKPGRAVITAKAENGKTARLKVTVVAQTVQTKAVKAAKTATVKLKKGKSTRLTVTPNPPGATLKKMPTFKSTKPKIASVDKTGLVTAKKKGKAKLTVTLAGKKTTLTIHVK